jgi:hypothetical protein
MAYVTKNRRENGDLEVIEGEVRFQNGGKITYDGVDFKPTDFQADSTATDVQTLVNDFNALLAKLRAAGLMKSS